MALRDLAPSTTLDAHPLDPLDEAEYERVVAQVKSHRSFAPSFRFASVALAEPAKADVLQWEVGRTLPRLALAVVWNRADNLAYEVVVEIGQGAGDDRVESFVHVSGATPNFTLDEWHECESAMKADPRVVAKLAERGFTDLDLILIDVWTYGHALMPEKWREKRLGWADVWRRASPTGNPYAHPVAGLKLIVDMNTMELLEFDEQTDPTPAAEVMGEYEPNLVPGLRQRTDIAPLNITQPEGISFSVDGNLISWQNWSVRAGFTYREGLVLHQLTYNDNGVPREVAYRMSFAEMVVPYRDPSFDHYRRTAYDIGEWGLGYMTTSLELGCDCLGEIRYLDAVLTDSSGRPYTVKNAICLHEEDDAVLWKHIDANGRAEVRRSRRMVISMHATVANYEYLIYWRLYQDGNIECEVRATGIMVTTAIAEGAAPPVTGTMVDQRTYAPFHQHFLVARLDLDVDGQANTVLEVDSVATPIGPDNPYGLGLSTRATPVRSESESGRDVNWATQRSWKVVNPGKLNAMGTPVGYKLVPEGALPALMDPAAPQYLRAPVIGHSLWVTRHHDDERWPCGAYPTQSEIDGGITRWIADDEPLINTDVVLWYVFGIHHITRPEDWPIMPVDVISFWLKPFGFFDRNPSLDLPPSARAGNGEHGDQCH